MRINIPYMRNIEKPELRQLLYKFSFGKKSHAHTHQTKREPKNQTAFLLPIAKSPKFHYERERGGTGAKPRVQLRTVSLCLN